jgi:hypothetical protein
MVLKHTFLIITTIIAILQSCDKTQDFDREGLTYKDKLVYNNEFRLDGYYYSKDTNYMIMFYLNGGVFHGASKSYIGQIGCPAIDDGIRRLPYFWGYFIIENNLIKMQTYDPTSLSGYSEFKIQDNWFEIIDSVTIRQIKIRYAGQGFKDRIDTLRFNYCYPKPDSTNILMN